MSTPEKIIHLKNKYFFPNVMHFYQDPPLFVGGHGQYLYDSKDRKYLDCFAGVSVMNCGHCNPYITQKLDEQNRRLQHTSIIYLTEPSALLAEKLASILPGDMDKVFFCNSGTEANEGALLLARMATGKKGFIAFKGGLHGRSSLTMSVTGIPMWRIDPFPDPDVYFAESFGYPQKADPDYDRQKVSDQSLASVEEILKSHASEIAACIVEPIQGNGGIQVPSNDFFPRLKKLLEEYGVLMIVDEVQTGFARSGKMFAINHSNVIPDIMTVAKALGNGTPIGAFCARPNIAKHFNKPSASTLGGNPVSSVAGLAVLELIEKDHLCQRAQTLGQLLKEGLLALQKKYPLILDVRGLGLMLGVQLDDDGPLTDSLLESMKDQGFIIGKNGLSRNVLAFQPPLVIEESDIQNLLMALDETFKKL